MIWLKCKYFCKYPRMQQYVIFNVLKECSISKEEDVVQNKSVNNLNNPRDRYAWIGYKTCTN